MSESLAWTMAGLLLGTNLFWAYTVQRLINKLMSRNYFDLTLAESSKKVKTKSIVAESNGVETYDDPELGSLTEVLQ